MSKDDSLKPKLSEAVPPNPPPPASEHPTKSGRPSDADEPRDAAVKLANARTNAAIKDNDELLVDVGRGEQTAGRQGQ